ncbi:MAG: DUF4870 domain-containing protein [Verrucomicrobiaceae bacterium]
MSTPEDQSNQSASSITPTETTGGGMSKNEQNMGMLCHLLALSGFLVPFGNLIGPLVIWLIKREEMPFVESQGKESLNFQITISIAVIIGIILCFVIIGFLLLPVIAIFALVCVILASIETANGKPYRYPFCIRLIK